MSLALRILACSILVFLAVTDIRTRRLPARWTAIVATLYFVDAALAATPWRAVALHGLAGAVCFALAAGLFAMGWMGGGDVKLAGAIALWAGTRLAGFVFAVTSVAGLVLAILALGVKARERWSPRSPGTTAHALSPERGVPYGVALAAGGFAGILLPALLRG